MTEPHLPRGVPVPAGVDLSRPSVARMYDYYLDGRTNFAVDRVAAEAVIAAAPEVVTAAQANRTFLRRAVRYALRLGVRQFLDLGSGLPTVGNVHEIVRATDPGGRVVYVDRDPVAVAHAEALLAGDPSAAIIAADIRDINPVLTHPEAVRLLRPDEPTCVLLVSVLHFIEDLGGLLDTLRDRTAAGSLLVISHAALPSARYAAQAQTVAQLYTSTGTGIVPRSRTAIEALFTGFPLLPATPGGLGGPAGLVPVDQWHGQYPTGEPVTPPEPALAGFLAGIGRKPAVSTDGPAGAGRRLPPGVAGGGGLR